MKKKILCLIMLITLPLCLFFSGCSSKNVVGSEGQNPDDQIEFVKISAFGIYYDYEIYVNKATKVMYIIDKDGAITAMLNADGSPMVYQGEL